MYSLDKRSQDGDKKAYFWEVQLSMSSTELNKLMIKVNCSHCPCASERVMCF